MNETEWMAVEEEMRGHIVANAQAYLDNQVRLATAADQRAASLAGAFSAAATGVLAALILLVTAHPFVLHPYPVIAAGVVSALTFVVAAAFCVAALFPRPIWLPGSQPKSWYNDVERNRTFGTCLFGEASITQEKIDENRLILTKNARYFTWGALLGMLSPLIGTIVWLITSSSYWF